MKLFLKIHMFKNGYYLINFFPNCRILKYMTGIKLSQLIVLLLNSILKAYILFLNIGTCLLFIHLLLSQLEVRPISELAAIPSQSWT